MSPAETMQLQAVAIEKAESAKRETELVRFKQDCRKRALDMAKECMQIEYSEWGLKKEGDNPTIMSLADKYYKWLIG